MPATFPSQLLLVSLSAAVERTSALTPYATDTLWASFWAIFFRKFFWDFINGILRNPGGLQ